MQFPNKAYSQRNYNCLQHDKIDINNIEIGGSTRDSHDLSTPLRAFTRVCLRKSKREGMMKKTRGRERGRERDRVREE